MLYALHTVPGLETVALDEMRYRLLAADVVKMQPGLLVISTRASAQQLLDLRTVEDVFIVVSHIRDLLPTRRGLSQIREGLSRGNALEEALAAYHAVYTRRVKRITFRVVAQKVGSHGFRRVDARDAAVRAIAARQPRWKPVAEDAHVEFWLDIRGDLALSMLRLSDRTMRHRAYKRAHIPASLRPTVAAAMVFLSLPEEKDTFVDGMCGAGTILMERALMGRAERIVGGDVDREALEAAAINIGPGAKVGLVRWDARRLPLPDGSVDKVVTNLPFGKQVGSPGENAELYARWMGELARVLRPRGRAVLLTGDSRLLGAQLSGAPLRSRRRVAIRVLGQPATIHVLEPARG